MRRRLLALMSFGNTAPSASSASTAPGSRGAAEDRRRLFSPLPDRARRSGEERFDLAITLEVAEHLPPERAAGFVEELCTLAPIVLFSAAIPDQGGTHHLNEQWPEYWVAEFSRLNYRPIDAIRPRIWTDPEIYWWYRQNCLLFVSTAGAEGQSDAESAGGNDARSGAGVSSPRAFRRGRRADPPSLKKWLRGGPGALARWREKRRLRRQAR